MGARSWWLMIAIGLGIMLNPLNSSMVSVAIPDLQQAFGLDFTKVSWIIFSFYIASAVAQPVMGKASDLFGRRKIFIMGLLVAFAASLFAPLSTSFGWLIVFRVVQSIGTSMMIAVGMAIVRVHVTEKQAIALSVLSIFLSGAAAIGPFIGGMLMHWWDWQAIFLVNLPFVIGSLVLAWRVVPKDGRPSSERNGTSVRQWIARMDPLGIALFTGGLITLLIGLLSAKSSGHLSLTNIIVGLIGIILLFAFIKQQLRTSSPFIPLRTFAQYPSLTWVNVEFMLMNMLFYSVFFGLPSYLQTVRHVSEYHTGMLMLSLGVCSLAASPIAGRWVERSGPRPALIVSALLMTVGSIWLITLNEHSPVVLVSLALAAFGISNGLNSVGMQAALFRSAPTSMIGVASGLFLTSRYIGTILSSLLIGVVMGGHFSYHGFRMLSVILTVIALTLVVISKRRRQEISPRQQTKVEQAS
ncbi:EmrB/QacA subfamily drug resistance transporter [Paenibacillus cellulosilyticus]|uniref:EmrB/QacA subfamily drug resistance transporter n=1 Tax=Paenibacillus cellulosilyticus TaxID=375489 RepID=A0A2V2YWC5_9BACL|nr:MFS transporter [Paenibacillus cellulosilyticus]PWW02926.1 EmrB/QacA subfamily drug resistance transporter [Paenibacillus cellulosilyticus]QKS45834.1 MFS transporter [Paenibacillus cellulosilyticus]